MGSLSTPVRRLLALSLLGVHLLLAVATVPHVHPLAVTGGVKTANHPPCALPPHRHWGWGGHGHSDHGHSHGSPRAGGSHARQGDAPADHEQDALYLADAFLVPETGALGLGAVLVTRWITLPSRAGPDDGTPSSRPWRVLRPPGDWRPTHHALLPHVLRI